MTTTDEMADLGRQMWCVLEKGAPEGTELWPLHPSTLYARFQSGRFQGKRLFVLTWDAAPQGYAALLVWWERDASARWTLRRMLFVGTWPRGSNVEHRPHREILGAYLATECAAQHIDLRGRMILFRNDAEAAILALTKGSFASPLMQRSAVRLNRLLFRLDVLPLYRHVPGLTLVHEGVDGASRGGGCHGWRATIDLLPRRATLGSRAGVVRTRRIGDGCVRSCCGWRLRTGRPARGWSGWCSLRCALLGRNGP